MLSKNDQQTALRLARTVLECHVKNQNLPTFEELGLIITPSLKEKRGAFVTLYKKSAAVPKILRGCIGTILPVQPLYQAVIANTMNAASRDVRFLRVREEELKELILEINVLTPPHAVDSYNAIRLGVDGIILSQGSHHALFLPAVPIEWGWNLSETLTQLAKKAGLPELSWQDASTQFQVFQSESFSE